MCIFWCLVHSVLTDQSEGIRGQCLCSRGGLVLAQVNVNMSLYTNTACVVHWPCSQTFCSLINIIHTTIFIHQKADHMSYTNKFFFHCHSLLAAIVVDDACIVLNDIERLAQNHISKLNDSQLTFEMPLSLYCVAVYCIIDPQYI